MALSIIYCIALIFSYALFTIDNDLSILSKHLFLNEMFTTALALLFLVKLFQIKFMKFSFYFQQCSSSNYQQHDRVELSADYCDLSSITAAGRLLRHIRG